MTAKDDAFIAEQLEAGEYGNVSEVVRAGLRLLEREQLKVAALKQAIAEGDAAYARGEFTTFDTAAEFADDLKSRLMKRQQRTRD